MDGMERLDRRVQTMLARTGEGSRRLAQRLIEAGDVRVNGVIVRRVSTPVRADARIEIAARPTPPPKTLVDVAILFEGEGLLAIDKPKYVRWNVLQLRSGDLGHLVLFGEELGEDLRLLGVEVHGYGVPSAPRLGFRATSCSVLPS